MSPPQTTVGKRPHVKAPTSRPFAERALEATNEYGPLVFGLDPFGDLLVDWGLGDAADGLDRFVDIVVEACVGTVGVVKPQSAFYERHGWRGVKSLARLVESCRESGVLVLLDAKRGDVGSTNRAYAEAYLGAAAPIQVDAITITPYLGFESVRPVLDLAVASNASVFVVTRSTNPEGRAIQGSVHPNGNTTEQQIVADIAAENRRVVPGAIGPVGSVFGPTHGPPAFDLRIMNGLFLAPGVGAQGATPQEVASCFASCPERVLPSASRSLLQNGPDPSRLRAGALALGTELRDALHL
jgi:orotidine-5'-phosphate decarboxylase